MPVRARERLCYAMPEAADERKPVGRIRVVRRSQDVGVSPPCFRLHGCACWRRRCVRSVYTRQSDPWPSQRGVGFLRGIAGCVLCSARSQTGRGKCAEPIVECAISKERSKRSSAVDRGQIPTTIIRDESVTLLTNTCGARRPHLRRRLPLRLLAHIQTRPTAYS